MAGRSNHSSSSKTVVGILSEYFFKDSTLDQLSKHCPSASFIKIEPAGKLSKTLATEYSVACDHLIGYGIFYCMFYWIQ